jgi:hypothetical protein
MIFRFSVTTLALAAGLALPACTLAQGMGAMGTGSSSMHSGAMVAPAKVFDKMLSGEEKEIVDLVEAMPADKFNFAPTDSIGKYDGVSSFSAQVKHLASANYGFFSGFGVPGGKTRAELAGLTTREQIIQALKDSYTYAHAAVATITPANAFIDMDGKGTTRAGMAAYELEHNNDHYGQLVEYLRMNGEIPPASRK